MTDKLKGRIKSPRRRDKRYIEQTTAKERLIIDSALNGVFATLDRGNKLLAEVIEEHFSSYEENPIEAYEVSRISNKLHIVEDIIFDAILTYSLTVCDETFGGVQPHLESAERVALAFKVQRKLLEVFPRCERAERSKEIMRLPDEEAYHILEREGVNVDE